MHKSLPDLIHSLYESRQIMVAQLSQLAEINSSSYNFAGLNTMRQTLNSLFIPLADEINSINFPPVPYINMAGDTTMLQCQNALFIRKRPHLKRRIILSGHMDTVYGINNPFQNITFLDENRLKGPGVTDMKGGLLVIFHALRAFEKTPFRNEMGWDVLISADEEIGSPASAQFIEKISPNYKVALVYEPAMKLDGTFAKNRKGSGKLTLISEGKEAHSGRNFDLGRNAIVHLAKAINAIDALNGIKKGVTINTGKIKGGSALNVIPKRAVAKFDIRISHEDDEIWLREQLDNILNNISRKDYSLISHLDFARPVKKINKATEQLFSRLQKLGKEIQLDLSWLDSGGCCDGNNFSKYGLAVLDTLGVIGDNIHSSEEYILLDSLVERSILSALLLVELSHGGIEELFMEKQL